MEITYPKDHKVIMREDDGPFRCDHCEYWIEDSEACQEKNIIKIASSKNKYDLSINEDGHAAPLAAGDCSDFFKSDSMNEI